MHRFVFSFRKNLFLNQIIMAYNIAYKIKVKKIAYKVCYLSLACYLFMVVKFLSSPGS
jgi:hypothetical protein